jgi:hypothetical protein
MIATACLQGRCRLEREGPFPTPCGMAYMTRCYVKVADLPEEVATILGEAGLVDYLSDPEELIPLGDAVVLSSLERQVYGPRPLLPVADIVRLTTLKLPPSVRKAAHQAEEAYWAAQDEQRRKEKEQQALAETRRVLVAEQRKALESELLEIRRHPTTRLLRREEEVVAQLEQLSQPQASDTKREQGGST